ncbi:hypothetical protein GGR57DRAFT_467105 [Xylariaceae sp. FL1272]|nr:hypothetical protein GGR57DRAFT_467105 [Xylariaceae sp. FL1272]
MNSFRKNTGASVAVFALLFSWSPTAADSNCTRSYLTTSDSTLYVYNVTTDEPVSDAYTLCTTLWSAMSPINCAQFDGNCGTNMMGGIDWNFTADTQCSGLDIKYTWYRATGNVSGIPPCPM